MNETVTGEVETIVEETPSQAAAVEESDVVTLNDLMDEEQQEETVEQPEEDAPEAETTAGDDNPSPAKAVKSARDVSAAFSKRLAAEKNKMEKDPVYQLGKALAAQYGGDAAKALSELTDKRVEELAKDPAALAKLVLGQQERAKEPEPADLGKEQADQILADIRTVIPNDDEARRYIESDPEFIANCAEFGARAAKKMADRSMKNSDSAQRIAAKLNQNRALPQPVRPSGNARTKPVDFSSMSDKDFAAFEAKVRKARIDGKKIKLE